MRNRFFSIDFLRAVCIVGVIVIHTLSYNLTGGVENIIWNYLHFVVVGFVFCSGYVLFAIYRSSFTTFSSIFWWYKKRLFRLLVPFYVYLIIHAGLWFLFPNFFSGLGLRQSFSFFVQSVFLVGGADINWLVLLFVQLTIIFPFLVKGIEKGSKLLHAFVFLAFAITAWFTLFPFPYIYYRFVMWIPWSLVFYSSFLFFEKKISLAKIVGISGVVFVLLFWVFSTNNRSLILIDHKYPSDFFYLSYVSCITAIVLIISKLSFLQGERVKKWYVEISSQAYGLFFIHFVVLDWILTQKKSFFVLQNIFLQIFIACFASIGIAFVLNNLKKTCEKMWQRLY